MTPDARLRALSDRTRELVEELSIARQDVLSVADLNRAMQQILRNQLAILERLTSAPAPEAALENSAAYSRQVSRTVVSEVHGQNVELNGSGAAQPPVIKMREKEPGEAHSHTPTPMADERDDPRNRDLSAVSPMEPRELDSLVDDIDDKSLAEKILNESRVVGPSVARIFVKEFDNRDKDYEKGIEKLNRWISGGQSGTPFQWRGDRAYLNLGGAGPGGVRKYEEQLMKRMGFSRRLGRLTVPELRGEIVVYERP